VIVRTCSMCACCYALVHAGLDKDRISITVAGCTGTTSLDSPHFAAAELEGIAPGLLNLCLGPLAVQNATSRVPLCSCRNGAPVVLVNANGQGTPCKLQISSMDRADETVHVVRVSHGRV
jgi:hypothetical protein